MEDHIWPDSANEITEHIKATPEWARACRVAREAEATGQTQAWLVEHVTEALRTELDLDEVIAASGIPLHEPERTAARLYLALHLTAAVVADCQGIQRPLFPMIAGGVQVLTHTDDDFSVPMVIAIATPLTSGTICADFEQMCDRTFARTIGNHPEAVRDSSWFRRHQAGERWTEIALSDRRSGIAPEAVVNPKEYPDEVRKAADVVRHAAHRYQQRWTEVADSLSANPD